MRIKHFLKESELSDDQLDKIFKSAQQYSSFTDLADEWAEHGMPTDEVDIMNVLRSVNVPDDMIKNMFAQIRQSSPLPPPKEQEILNTEVPSSEINSQKELPDDPIIQPSDLSDEWLDFLKNRQIAKPLNDGTGKMHFFRRPTVGDVKTFLTNNTDADIEVIDKVIHTVMKSTADSRRGEETFGNIASTLSRTNPTSSQSSTYGQIHRTPGVTTHTAGPDRIKLQTTPLKEDITSRSTVSDNQIEAIFKELMRVISTPPEKIKPVQQKPKNLTKTVPTSTPAPPAAPKQKSGMLNRAKSVMSNIFKKPAAVQESNFSEKTPDISEELIEKLKTVLDKKLTESQIHELYISLMKSCILSESNVKYNVDSNTLHSAWKKRGYLDDSLSLTALLMDYGYEKENISSIMESIIGKYETNKLTSSQQKVVVDLSKFIAEKKCQTFVIEHIRKTHTLGQKISYLDIDTIFKNIVGKK